VCSLCKTSDTALPVCVTLRGAPDVRARSHLSCRASPAHYAVSITPASAALWEPRSAVAMPLTSPLLAAPGACPVLWSPIHKSGSGGRVFPARKKSLATEPHGASIATRDSRRWMCSPVPRLAARVAPDDLEVLRQGKAGWRTAQLPDGPTRARLVAAPRQQARSGQQPTYVRVPPAVRSASYRTPRRLAGGTAESLHGRSLGFDRPVVRNHGLEICATRQRSWTSSRGHCIAWKAS